MAPLAGASPGHLHRLARLLCRILDYKLAAMRENTCDRRPNILFLFSDQHRAGDLSCAGHPVVRTPALDRLAARGTRFTETYCPVPLCVPSRVAVLTDRYGHNTGVMRNLSRLREGERTFAQQLQQAGYTTCFTGKLHMALGCRTGGAECNRRLGELGFEHLLPTNGKEAGLQGQFDCGYRRFLREHGVFDQIAEDYRLRLEKRPEWYAEPFPVDGKYLLDNYVTRITRQWIEEYDGDRPFFLWCNWGGPHPPWDAPPPYDRRYPLEKIDPYIGDPGAGMPKELRKRCLGQRTPWPEEEAWRRCKAMYYGNVNIIDDGVGEILEALERRGWLDDTLVIYSSDHGEMLFDHGMLGKGVMYEPAVKVPLLVSWPARFRQGQVSAALSSTLDLVPLMLEVAGAEQLPIFHGWSLRPVLTGESSRCRPFVAAEMMKCKMVREGQWKYVYHPNWKTHQLFDLANDPDELHNLSGDPAYAEQEDALRERMLRWLVTTEMQPNTWPDARLRSRKRQGGGNEGGIGAGGPKLLRKRLPGQPLIVSGVGGSGTRLVADLLMGMGVFMGGELNRSSDNMLLAAQFSRIRNFMQRHDRRGGPADRAHVVDAVVDDVFDYFDASMAKAFQELPKPAPAWGWKLPASFLIVDRLHARYPGARFIHVVRHGLDMAFSGTRGQLHNWGWMFGIEPDPEGGAEAETKAQLDYWIAANDHFLHYAQEHLAPAQWLLLNFDDLCRDPVPLIERLATFVGFDPSRAVELATLVRRPDTLGRYRRHDLSLFDERQFAAVESYGFLVER